MCFLFLLFKATVIMLKFNMSSRTVLIFLIIVNTVLIVQFPFRI